MERRLGILIAGSLLWRSESYREQWRAGRLTLKRIPVRAPVRYGRRSRSDTFTMVFAPGCPLGQAVVATCQRLIGSVDELRTEAKELWIAERPAGSTAQRNREHSADWGCVVLLANPATQGLAGILNAWAVRVAHEKDSSGHPTYDPAQYSVAGVSSITSAGLLNVPWPTLVDRDGLLEDCDLLLATATRPTPLAPAGDFPDAVTIASAWNTAGAHANNAEYFKMNIGHGIKTFQDDDIQSALTV
jgi:hypothetical protein